MVSFTQIATFITTISTFTQAMSLLSLPGESPIPGESPVQTCDAFAPKILTIKNVDLTPNPPKKGTTLSIAAEGFVAQDIAEGAYVDVEVRYGYIKLLTQTFDLCEQLEEVNLSCPLKEGDYIISKEVDIPNEVPPGKYTVYARAYTVDDEYIACLTATVVFTIDGSVALL